LLLTEDSARAITAIPTESKSKTKKKTNEKELKKKQKTKINIQTERHCKQTESSFFFLSLILVFTTIIICFKLVPAGTPDAQVSPPPPQKTPNVKTRKKGTREGGPLLRFD
jgi:hypothetical protein